MRVSPLLLALAILPAPARGQQPAPARPDSAVTLPPLNVTVTRVPAGLATVPMAITVLDRSDLGPARANLTVDDVLAAVPGLYLANRYNYSLDQRVSIRGFGSRSNFGLRGVKVLLDGVPQTLPDGQGQLTNVDFGTIQRVEVLRGSSSSLYGNASGGVIALETSRPGAGASRAEARAEAGAFGLVRWAGRADFRRGLLGGTLGVSRFSLDGFRRHSAAEAVQAHGALEYVMSGHGTLTVRAGYADAPRADNPGALTPAEFAADREAAAPNNVARRAGKEVSQQQASVSYRHDGDSGTRTEVTVFGLRRDLRNPLATNVFITLDRWAGGLRFATTRYVRSPALRVTAGADLQAMRDDRMNSVASTGRPTDTLLLDQRESVTEIGPFLHLVWQAGPRWQLAGGIRYDRVSFTVRDHFLADSVDNSGNRTMSAVSGHAGASLAGWDALVPYVNMATSFETPTTTELVNQPGGSGGFNDAVGPQRALSYEAGVRGRAGRVLEYSIAAFRSRIDNALVPFSEVGGRAYFTNAGRLDQNGVEIGVRLARGAAWNLAAAYTLAAYRFDRYRITTGTAVDTLDGNRLAGVPRHHLRLIATGSPLPGLRLELEQQLTSRLYADDRNTIEAPGWGAGVTTIRGAMEVQAGAISLLPFFGIHNLFNREYVSSVTVNGFGGRVFEPGPGRNGYAGLAIRYR